MTSREEVVGRELFDVFGAHDQTSASSVEELRRAMQRAVNTGDICTAGPFRYDLKRACDAEQKTDDGAGKVERYWTVRSVPIRNESGEVAHVVNRIEDVTDFVFQERSQNWRGGNGAAEEVVNELRKSLEQKTRRQFYDMFMKAPAFICMLEGPKHTFMMANPAYYELIDHREVIGRTVGEVFPEEGIDKFGMMLDSVYDTGTPQIFHEQEIELREPESGQPYTIYATFAYLPTYNLHGEIEGVAVFGFEVTELVTARQEVEAQAARAERESRHKDEFLAMLGHELRNPLAPISMALEVMRDQADALDADRLDWGVELIERQHRQMTRLVDDLLDVARIERGQIDLQLEPCSLSSIVSGAVESCQPLIERKSQSLEVALPQGPVTLEADAARLTQVVANGRRADAGARGRRQSRRCRGARVAADGAGQRRRARLRR